jgi:hypothetical protein
VVIEKNLYGKKIGMGSFKRFRGAIAAFAVAISLLLASAGVASASSIVWNDTGGSVPMFWGTSSSSGVESWLSNSSHFEMVCWTDDQWYYGDYWTPRWFFGQSYDTGEWGSVPASYVYYQESVPHC